MITIDKMEFQIVQNINYCKFIETISSISKNANIQSPGVIIIGKAAKGMFDNDDVKYNSIQWGQGCVQFLNPIAKHAQEQLP